MSNRPYMTHHQFAVAQKKLGLTDRQFAKVLETDQTTIRCMKMDPSKKSHRPPAVRMIRLIWAYEDGWRPADWPKT